MPFTQLTAKLYKSVLYRNQNANASRVEKETLMAIGRHYGYSRGEVGYAIQLLKGKDMLRYYPRSGWVALKV